jgi:hypothetical protein
VTLRPVPALSVDPVSVTFPVFETVPLVETSVVVFRARIALLVTVIPAPPRLAKRTSPPVAMAALARPHHPDQLVLAQPVERFFALLTERQIRRGIHRSIAASHAIITAFMEETNFWFTTVDSTAIRRPFGSTTA